jgi:7-keto-8-aminopelargonate synthetase-like enzyme
VDFLLGDEGEKRRLALWQNIRLLQSQLPPSPGAVLDEEEDEAPARPRPVSPPSSIFPWIVGTEADAVDFSNWLAKAGFFAPAIRYPTVPRGTARLRLTVTARHRPEQIHALGRALSTLAGQRAA